MTNAEKLSKNMDYMVNSLLCYCESGHSCQGCIFADISKDWTYECTIRLDTNDNEKRVETARNFLMSKAKEEKQ